MPPANAEYQSRAQRCLVAADRMDEKGMRDSYQWRAAMRQARWYFAGCPVSYSEWCWTEEREAK